MLYNFYIERVCNITLKYIIYSFYYFISSSLFKYESNIYLFNSIKN